MDTSNIPHFEEAAEPVSKSDAVRALARDIVACLPEQNSVEAGADAMTALSLAIAHVFLTQAKGNLTRALSAVPSAPFAQGVGIALISLSKKPL